MSSSRAILDVFPHPDADKIRLCRRRLRHGADTCRVRRANIHPGMVAPFATSAPRCRAVPGEELEERKIRGVLSDGMLCSSRELGLGDDHSGIVELPDDTPTRHRRREALGLDDVVFDLSITPNRPDAMGIVGVARELAAHFGLPLDVPDLEPRTRRSTRSATSRWSSRRPAAARASSARVATVTMGESPEWMQRRLRLAGMRPISNVVDVTNYVMLERCRPLHAFDLGRLAGRGIVVRLASDGETMTTLDGVERALTARTSHLRRAARAAGHRRDHGRRRLRGRRQHHRDPHRVGAISSRPASQSREAARPAFGGERALRTRHRSQRHRARRG